MVSAKEVLQQLPMEFAVEAKLVSISLEGSVDNASIGKFKSLSRK